MRYKDILSLKSENPELFKDTIPIIETFRQQIFYIHEVYKRLQESGIEEFLVSAGVLELYHHLQIVEYFTYCNKPFELREHLSPISNRWKVENGKCRAVT